MRETQRRHKAANAKARALQNWIRDRLISMLPDGAYESREMGQPGTDIKDPHDTLPFTYLDAKNWAKYPSMAKIIKDMESKGAHRWVAVLKQTDGKKSVPYVLMNWDLFYELVGFYLYQNARNREERTAAEQAEHSLSLLKEKIQEVDSGSQAVSEDGSL